MSFRFSFRSVFTLLGILCFAGGALGFSAPAFAATDSCKDKALASFPQNDVVDMYCISSGDCPGGPNTATFSDTTTCTAFPGQKCCVEMKPKPSTGAKAPQTGTGASLGSSTKLNDPLKGVGLYGLVNRLISTVLGLVGAMALLVFFTAGVMYMVGTEEMVSKAKAAMTSAVIGLAIIFSAYLITNVFFQALTSGSAQ